MDSTNENSTEPTAEIVEVTPDIAAQWLEANTHNRRLRQGDVTKYATDMKNGDWVFNFVPMEFGNDGTIHDGQHRLWAVIESGTTQRFLVVRNMPPEAQYVVDTGIKRTMVDVLRLRNEKDYTQLAAGIKVAFTYEFAGPGTGKRFWNIGKYAVPSVPQMLRFLEEHPELREYAVFSTRFGSKPIPSSVISFLLYAYNIADPEDGRRDVEAFIERVSSQLGHEDGQPAWTLRRTVLNYRDTPHLQPSTETIAAYAVKALNAYRAGQEIKLLKWRVGGSSPEAFPTPK